MQLDPYVTQFDGKDVTVYPHRVRQDRNSDYKPVTTGGYVIGYVRKVARDQYSAYDDNYDRVATVAKQGRAAELLAIRDDALQAYRMAAREGTFGDAAQVAEKTRIDELLAQQDANEAVQAENPRVTVAESLTGGPNFPVLVDGERVGTLYGDNEAADAEQGTRWITFDPQGRTHGVSLGDHGEGAVRQLVAWLDAQDDEVPAEQRMWEDTEETQAEVVRLRNAEANEAAQARVWEDDGSARECPEPAVQYGGFPPICGAPLRADGSCPAERAHRKTIAREDRDRHIADAIRSLQKALNDNATVYPSGHMTSEQLAGAIQQVGIVRDLFAWIATVED